MPDLDDFKHLAVKSRKGVRLTDLPTDSTRHVPDREKADEKTAVAVARLGELQDALYAEGRQSVLVVLQGMDASGKDGLIRRVFSACNPMGCQVARFQVPTELEQQHDFLWRVHAVVPPRGLVGIFNRSHYEELLVPRVRGLVAADVWQRRFAHVNAFEQLLADAGVAIVKLCLHVSRDEQRRRLSERIEDPEKNWKFRLGDLDDRAQWDAYTAAYHDLLARCSTAWAPWYRAVSTRCFTITGRDRAETRG